MLTYEDARKTALDCVEDKSWFNFCTEYENAFVFSKYDDISIGGISPCAVMKNDGSTRLFEAVLGETGGELHTYIMGEDGKLEEIPTDMYWDVCKEGGAGWVVEEE